MTNQQGPICVPVTLADHSYDVMIGQHLLEQAGSIIAPLLKRPQAVIVTDKTVSEFHLGTLITSLEASNITSQAIILPAGESTKSWTQLEALTDALLEAGVERADHIIALGGGVIGDLVGFAASILRRGVRFIQIPTTLLAQVDSSVGGKTAINVARGKNLIGAFHQPSLVLADLSVLETLPDREMRAGYAEVVKYGLIGDAAFYDWLIDHGEAVLGRDGVALAHAVATSVRAKAKTVAADEKEKGERALLNLGHTFGHALEAELGYDGRLLHGEAVAMGLVMADALSKKLSNDQTSVREPIDAHLRRLGFTVRLADLEQSLGLEMEPSKLIGHMAQDKKMDAGTLTFITGPIGAAQMRRDIDMAMISDILEDSRR